MASNTRLALVPQGITRPEHLIELKEEDIKILAETLRRPVGIVPDPTDRRWTVPAPVCLFSVISQIRVRNAILLLKYYVVTSFYVTADILALEIIKLFKLEYDALVERKDMVITTPKISSSLPIIKWIESFSDMLSRVIGSRNILLAYAIRLEVSVPPVFSIARAANHSYSIK